MLILRTRFLWSGFLFCIVGGGIILYQISESCENTALANTFYGYPWCSDILEHINLTFVGVVALIAGAIILALGGALHWILEPTEAGVTD